MSNNPPTQPPDDPEELPPELRDQLRSLYAPPTALPVSRDREILSRARRQPAFAWRARWLARGAIAASIALAAGTLWYLETPIAPPSPPLSPPTAAYVRTGDIRDAFYLQRQLDRGHPVSLDWDQNHDGIVDGSDVQAFAFAAVRLPAAEGALR